MKEENTQLRSLKNTLLTKSGLTFETAIDCLKEFLTEELKRKPFNVNFYPKSKPKPPTKPIFDSKHEETACLVLSDWHLGETVQPLEINGMNKHNTVILSNKLYDIVKKFITIIRGHQIMYNISNIWIPVIGDMISGSIHPELILTNDLLDIPATILASRLIILCINEIKTLGIPIKLDCVVGNHPRTSLKMPTKQQAHTNYDWLVYTMVQDYFRDDKLVEVNVHLSQFAIVECYSHRIIIEHGYGVKSAQVSKLPASIRGIFDSHIYREATGLVGTALDYVIIGDKHQYEIGNGYMVNGTLVGSSELTTSWRLAPLPSSQMMFGLSKSHIPTYVYPLDVTTMILEEGTNPFSKYTKEFMKIHGR